MQRDMALGCSHCPDRIVEPGGRTAPGAQVKSELVAPDLIGRVAGVRIGGGRGGGEGRGQCKCDTVSPTLRVGMNCLCEREGGGGQCTRLGPGVRPGRSV